MIIRTILAMILGATIGYTYYRLVGCSSGTCPITSNPWMTTAYGALVGLMFAGGK